MDFTLIIDQLTRAVTSKLATSILTTRLGSATEVVNDLTPLDRGPQTAWNYDNLKELKKI
jgi:hypothetical protein